MIECEALVVELAGCGAEPELILHQRELSDSYGIARQDTGKVGPEMSHATE